MVKLAGLAAAALLVVAAIALIAFRLYRQSVNREAFAIRTPNGINEGLYVTAGGIQQWVQIRGQDRANPVLLCVHGGPGGTWLPVTRLFIPWEKHFTVVQWDQRGAGKTLKASGPSIAPTMSVERMVQDGIEVVEYLRGHLKTDKVVLLGHSWGSILGINMVQRRPELFHAFVGTGQVSDLPRSVKLEYGRLIERAREANDRETLRKLTEIGAPPFQNAKAVAAFFDRVAVYQPASDGVALSAMQQSLLSPPPEFSLRDEVNRFRGFASVPPWALYEEMLNTNLRTLGADLSVSLFIFQGSEDRVTPAALAREYFDFVRAPRKEMVLLEGGGHFAVWAMADRFGQELVARVRPRALTD